MKVTLSSVVSWCCIVVSGIVIVSCGAGDDIDPVGPPQWSTGGSLHEKNLADWSDATEVNKLATAAELLRESLWKGRLQTETDYEKLKESSMRLVNTLDELANNIDHLKRWDANMAERTVRYIVEEGAVKGEDALWGETPFFGPSTQGQNSEEIGTREIDKEIETLINELQKN